MVEVIKGEVVKGGGSQVVEVVKGEKVAKGGERSQGG